MGIADIPTNLLGPSFLIRSFIPGFIASSLYYIAFMPLLNASCNFMGQTEYLKPFDILLILAFMSLIMGMMLSELDVQIYQLFESLRFWPNFLWDWRYKRAVNRFKEIDKGLETIKQRKKEIKKLGESSCEEDEIRDLICRESDLSAKAREFPFNPDSESFCKRYPDAATRFGNVIAEYEQYPEIQYGMHMLVFWQHLWLVLPSDVKEDLDLRGAKVDFLVYLSFILFTYAFIGGFAFYLSSKAPALLAICLMVSLSLSFLFYLASISSAKNYGRYIKAVFDLYRFDLAERMGINISSKHIIPDEEEIMNWRRLRRYLLDYKKQSKQG
jgi:hypothetical protein